MDDSFDARSVLPYLAQMNDSYCTIDYANHIVDLALAIEALVRIDVASTLVSPSFIPYVYVSIQGKHVDSNIIHHFVLVN